MFIAIAAMVVLTVAAAVWMIRARAEPPVLVFDQRPDRPTGFGHDVSWIAIRTRDPERVLAVLELQDTEPANWRTGIAAVYDDSLADRHVFVSPPVGPWIFVVGRAIPAPTGSHILIDKCTPLIERLAEAFLECQYFAIFPGVDLFAWARAANGRIARSFAVGDSGVIWNSGRPGRDERALGLQLFEVRGVRERNGDVGGPLLLYPTPEQVLRIAASWSVDPTKLGKLESIPLGAGWVARVPRSWRSERVTQRAAA